MGNFITSLTRLGRKAGSLINQAPEQPGLNTLDQQPRLPTVTLASSNHQQSQPPDSVPPTPTMAERTLQDLLRKLRTAPDYPSSLKLLSTAKLTLLHAKALVPAPTTSPSLLQLARDVFEAGALLSLRAKDSDSFTRYVHLLSPFYELPAERLGNGAGEGERNKITGLYLLLLLTMGNYSGFHTELEGLECRRVDGPPVENDRYLGYPIKLERWLMEGSYDLVWKAMASGEVPSEEYGVFSEILTSQIRSEIASCSETAYPSLPISSTKDLLFLSSEGDVVQFAQSRGWTVRDGRIYFPTLSKAGIDDDGNEKEVSKIAIENTLGYARELETIV